MTSTQRNEIKRLQQEGAGYRSIAAQLSLPVDSVKSWCRRHPAVSTVGDYCLQCGVVINHTQHKRKRKFCSDACRYKWWQEHPEKRASEQPYAHICAFCGKEFRNNRLAAVYCSRRCFSRARTKGVFYGQTSCK